MAKDTTEQRRDQIDHLVNRLSAAIAETYDGRPPTNEQAENALSALAVMTATLISVGLDRHERRIIKAFFERELAAASRIIRSLPETED